ncbi:hypothetical protein C0389_04365 [bacterium]|nr:hypothetical protein [bacterium]
MIISEKQKKRLHEFEKTISKSLQILEKLQRRDSNFGWIRLSIFLIGLIFFFTFFFLDLKTISLLNLIPFTILFIAFTIFHNKTIQAVNKVQRWIEIKKSYLARANLDWQNIPAEKTFSRNDVSPIEMDLDLTGPRSLHQLLDFSKSSEGSILLRKLLIERPQNSNQIIHRQDLVKELLSLSHFRDKFLLVNSLSSKEELDTNSLLGWLARSEKTSKIKKILIILGLICFTNFVFIFLAILGIAPIIYLYTTFFYFVVYNFYSKLIKSSSSDAEIINNQLKKVIGVLSFVENYKFGANKCLSGLCSPLSEKGKSPSKQLNKINSVLSLLSMRSNPAVWMLFMLVCPIDYFLAYRIEVYKKGIVKNLPVWLDVWYKLEAFVSIANFAYINPDYSFSRVSEENKLELSCKGIGHPLINHEKNVTNDFQIREIGNISIITGSNMSGKSTFLRTVGINICLTFIGAPVCADYFSLSMVRIFTCIRVSDSVIDGISYFYAEVKRLKELLDHINMPGEIPILFLIDEIFKGTNNIERLQGSRAIIKVLANKNGSGLISTHDLELVKLTDEIPSISNYHFREEVLDKVMIFDYRLKNGPCPTTNALKIMKANGLPI